MAKKKYFILSLVFSTFMALSCNATAAELPQNASAYYPIIEGSQLFSTDLTNFDYKFMPYFPIEINHKTTVVKTEWDSLNMNELFMTLNQFLDNIRSSTYVEQKPTPTLPTPTPKPQAPNTVMTKLSIGYITTTNGNGYNKISANVTLPSVSGVDKDGEAAYNFFGLDGTGDKIAYNAIDFGFCKAKGSNGWSVVSSYATTEKASQDRAASVSYSKNPGVSIGRYDNKKTGTNSKITYRVWSSFSKIINIPDNTKIFFELYISGKDEITLHIKYGSHDTKLIQYFSGANIDGKALQFRRECNLIAEGKNGKISAAMTVSWENLYKYSKNAKIKWLDPGHFYCDNGNKVPTNVFARQNLPTIQTIIYGTDKK